MINWLREQFDFEWHYVGTSWGGKRFERRNPARTYILWIGGGIMLLWFVVTVLYLLLG